MIYGIGAVDIRSQAQDGESRLSTRRRFDRYNFIRRAYLCGAEYLVYDGKPPPEKEDEE